jgi:Fe-S-cluster containining protein
MPLGESMCDSCLSPGACCKRLTLSGPFAKPMSLEAVEHKLIDPDWISQTKGVFRPGTQTDDGRWEFWCTALGADGRCTIYEDRPQLCRDYRPGHDGLCIHYWPDPESPTPMAAEEIPA